MKKKSRGEMAILQTAQEMAALDHVTRFKKSLDLVKGQIDAKSRRLYSMYRGEWKREHHGYRGRSRLFMKETMKGIQTFIANITQGLLSGDKPFALRGRTPDDDLNQQKNEDLILYQFQETEFESKLDALVETCAWRGFCVARVNYVRKVRTRKSIQDERIAVIDETGAQKLGVDGQPLYENVRQVVDEDITDYEGPSVEPCDIMQIWFNPKWGDIQDGPGIAYEYDATYDDLKAMEKSDENPDLPYSGVDRILLLPDEQTRNGMTSQSDLHLPEKTDFGNYRVTEFWGRFRPPGGKKSMEYAIVIVNDTVVLRVEANPRFDGRRPFILATLMNGPDATGLGLAELAESDNIFLNDLINQRLDNVTLVINRMWKYIKGKIDLNELFSGAGNAIGCEQSLNEVEAVLTPDVTASAYREGMEAKQNIREVIGATDPIQGIPTTNNQTATEINRITLSANKKFLRFIKRLERNLLMPIVELFYDTNQQTVSDTLSIRLGIGPIQKVGPEDIRGNFDVIPVASTEIVTSSEAESLQSFLKLLAETGGAQRWDIGKIEERMARTIGLRGVDDLKAQPPVPVQPGVGGSGTMPGAPRPPILQPLARTA